MTYCKGCGTKLPPQGQGRERLWCTDRCRKQTMYARACVDCGAELNGSDGRGPNAPTRCVGCGIEHQRTDMGYRRRAARVSKARGLKWSDKEIIEALRVVWDEVGPMGPIRWHEMGYAPSQATIQNRFGGWRAAVRGAGLEPVRRNGRPGGKKRSWSKEDCYQAVRDLSAELGHPATHGEYEASGYKPSAALIRIRLGHWPIVRIAV